MKAHEMKKSGSFVLRSCAALAALGSAFTASADIPASAVGPLLYNGIARLACLVAVGAFAMGAAADGTVYESVMPLLQRVELRAGTVAAKALLV